MTKKIAFLALVLTATNLAANGYLAYRGMTNGASVKLVEVSCYRQSSETVCFTS